MRYPIVPIDHCMTLTAEYLAKGWRPIEPDEMALSGRGPDADLRALADAATLIRARLAEYRDSDEASDRDRFEGEAAGMLHRATRELPLMVLDDPQFWRFVGLQHLWQFVHWRERERFDSGEPTRYLRLVDARVPHECVVTRMFLRAQVARRGDDYTLASALGDSAELWHGHILKRDVAASPPLARALVASHLDARMSSSELRTTSRNLERLTANLVTAMIDDDQARDLVALARSTGEV